MAFANKIKSVAAGVLAISLLTPLAAAAEEKSPIPGTFSANVGMVSEYFFRGISQTDDAPAVQGGFDYEIEAAKDVTLYAGIWGSNVDFNDGASGATLEIDYYGGLRTAIGETGLSLDAGFIYYSYPGAAGSLNYDFWEVQAALGYDFGPAAVTASLNYSPENFGESGAAYYWKGAIDIPVKMFTLSAYLARQNIEDNTAFGSPDYTEWNVSLGTSYAGFDFSLAYSDTNISPAGDGNSEAVIFSVSRSF